MLNYFLIWDVHKGAMAIICSSGMLRPPNQSHVKLFFKNEVLVMVMFYDAYSSVEDCSFHLRIFSTPVAEVFIVASK